MSFQYLSYFIFYVNAKFSQQTIFNMKIAEKMKGLKTDMGCTPGGHGCDTCPRPTEIDRHNFSMKWIKHLEFY
jgi:hypothetical protein